MASDHVTINRDQWNRVAAHWVADGERLWAGGPQWGIWRVPDSELNLLPGDMTGMDAVELGCGTGYVAGWMARRGARVLAVDVSAEQLKTARSLAATHGAEIEFREGNAEAVDAPDESFDFAISEYGAAIWCDPDLWVKEAARLLRPGGRLVFLGNHPLSILCTPYSGAATDFTLHRPYHELSRLDWTEVEINPDGVSFNRTFEAWLRLFRETGFTVADYREIGAPASAGGDDPYVDVEWAKRYPNEQVWVLDKTG